MNDIVIPSKKTKCENTGKKWIRNCPNCDNPIEVSSKKYHFQCIRTNIVCKSCSLKVWHKEKNHFPQSESTLTICPNCQKPKPHYASSSDRICKSCAARQRYPVRKTSLLNGIVNNRPNHTHPDSIKSHVRFCPKCQTPIKHTSLHYITQNNHRVCKSCSGRTNNANLPYTPSFNPNGCRLIDSFSASNELNCIHGLNGGEYHIKALNYWVDGYDATKNVVVECYEPFHYSRGVLKSADVQREQEIINHLHCKFIRIRYNGKDTNILSCDIIKD